MFRQSFLIVCAIFALSTAAFADTASPSIGIVNFSQCATDSKLGKQEHNSFEALKKQMTTLLDETEKQINDLSAKFNDSEYLDGLSPEAEEELKVKFRSLNEDLNRYQNQYYQVLNQANMKLFQTVMTAVSQSAEKLAKQKKFALIVNKEACFFYAPQLDITSSVITEMDKNFDEEGKKQQIEAKAASTSAPTTPSSSH